MNAKDWPIKNSSWPQGLWTHVYDPSQGLYVITVIETGIFVALVASTLLADTLVQTNNEYVNKPEYPTILCKGK